MEKVIVVIVILVLVFVIYFLCVGGKKGKNREPAENGQPSQPASPAPAQPEKPRFEDIGTRLVSKLSMEQLDRNGRVVKTFDINEIPDVGVTISRPGAKQGDVILSELGGEDAMTVGTEGIVIAEDGKGMFGKIFDNGHEKNKLYLYDPVVNKSHEVTQFDIVNNTMICVGRQWLRFVVPTVPGAPVPAGGMAGFDGLRAASAPEAQARPDIYRDPRQPSAPHTRQVPQAYAQQMQQARSYPAQNRQNAQPYAQQGQPSPQPDAPKAVKPVAPSGFSFESSMDDQGRFVITKK